MRKYLTCMTLLLFVCLSMAQDRNLKIVKNPTENPTNQQRKAVVIGMSDCGSAGRDFENTLNDAEGMAETLRQLGFVVTLLKNNDYRTLRTNLTEWYKTIEGNDMAIFYFAGHGMEVKGENYLIPALADINSQTDVEDFTLRVNSVLGNMDEKRVRFKLLILDACRDNPFRGWDRSNRQQGLAPIIAPEGTFIAFAAAPGEKAQDGRNLGLRNGVFTHYLLQEIVKEGITIDEVFTKVAEGVSTLTSKQQIPFRNSSLTASFYFKPKANDRPSEVVADIPVAPSKPATPEKYYYYIDQNDNESNNRFADRKAAESEMRNRKLYGKIYSNAGEIFMVEKPAEPVSPAVQPIEPVKTVAQPNANRLDAVGISVKAVNNRGGEVKISRAFYLEINFQLVKNLTAPVGEKNIYIRLVKPDGDILRKSYSEVFTFENKEIAYSILKSIEYDGEEQSVKMNWNVEEVIPEGTYIVDIFADGIKIGLSRFVLE